MMILSQNAMTIIEMPECTHTWGRRTGYAGTGITDDVGYMVQKSFSDLDYGLNLTNMMIFTAPCCFYIIEHKLIQNY